MIALFPSGFVRKVMLFKGLMEGKKVLAKGMPKLEVTKAIVRGERKGLQLLQLCGILMIVVPLVSCTLLHLLAGWSIFRVALLGYLLAIGCLSPVILLLKQGASMVRKLELQMIDALTKIGVAISSGAISIPAAIESIASASPEPIRSELRLVYADMKTLAPLDIAIMGIARRNPSEIIARACSVIATSYRQVTEMHASVALLQAADMIFTTLALESEKKSAFMQPLMDIMVLTIFLLPITTILVASLLKQMAPLQTYVAQTHVAGVRYVNLATLMVVMPAYTVVESTVVVLLIGLFVKRDTFWTIQMLTAVFGMTFVAITIIGL